MPRSKNLDPGAPRPGNVDLNRKVIRKRSVLERGGRILESRGPGGRGERRPRSRNLVPEAPRPGNVDLNKKVIRKRSVFEREGRILESRGPGGGIGGAQILESGPGGAQAPIC